MDNPYMTKAYEIIKIKKETMTDSTYIIKADIVPNFGQFFQVSLPGVGEAPISVSDFDGKTLSFTIRNAGKVTNEIHKLKAGDKLYLRGPYGNGFNIEVFRNKHLVIVAGGIGIAPVRSLINYYYGKYDELEKLDLLFGFRNPDNILFRDEIDKWRKKIPMILTVDEACGVWDGECVGLVTQYVKDISIKDYFKIVVVIVGPSKMMKYTANEFVKRGINLNNIIISFERNMSCGIGKCGHCKINDKYVCVDGPVFKYSESLLLKD